MVVVVVVVVVTVMVREGNLAGRRNKLGRCEVVPVSDHLKGDIFSLSSHVRCW